MTSFEDHLWSHLAAEHDADRLSAPQPGADQGGKHRLLVSGSAAAMIAVVLAVVVLVTATNATPPAYAVTENSDGTATVTLREISAVGPLNARLASLGLRLRAIPVTEDCHAKERIPFGYGDWKTSLNVTVTVGNRWLPEGFTGFMAVRQTGSGTIEASFGSIPTADMPSCISENAGFLTPQAAG